MAFVVLSADVRKEDHDKARKAIEKHVSDHKVRYKWLDGGVEFVNVIPKNPSGKILVRSFLS